MQWRLINTGYNTGAYNMAVDEVLLRQVSTGRSKPVIRFYGWKPPAITLGYFQDLEREIDTASCRKRGIDIVRRLTGGRAVLHHYEVTYSVIAPEKDERVSGTIIQSYLKISRGLVAGLRSLGIPAELTPHGKKPGPDSTAACFEAPSWYEIVIDGKKLVGSAQTRKNGTLLQHGSVLLDLDVEELADTIKFKRPEIKERFIKSFPRKACAVNQVMDRKFDFDTVAAALTKGFEQEFRITLVPENLTVEEQALVRDLVPKYTSPDWNLHRKVT
ncbi:MAG: lipoate--protein ligase family protein [Thermoanaerobacteraceae bacterium]|nr:lipoate--protein ligase family protein [Thermoanaerobacteraceae bacterium]